MLKQTIRKRSTRRRRQKRTRTGRLEGGVQRRSVRRGKGVGKKKKGGYDEWQYWENGKWKKFYKTNAQKIQQIKDGDGESKVGKFEFKNKIWFYDLTDPNEWWQYNVNSRQKIRLDTSEVQVGQNANVSGMGTAISINGRSRQHAKHEGRYAELSGTGPADPYAGPLVLHLDMKDPHDPFCTKTPKTSRRNARESIYGAARRWPGPGAQGGGGRRCEFVAAEGGCTTAAMAIHEEEPALRLGVMVAANSGRPAGAVGGITGADKVHPGHRTQEEDIVSNWLSTESNGDSEGQDDLYLHTIYQAWGLCTPIGSTDTATIQGVDYVHATNPTVYADAWVVQQAKLSAKTRDPLHDGEWMFDVSRSFPAALVFVAGPNAGNRGTAQGSMSRTCSLQAALRTKYGYDFFERGVKEALRTGLDAMAAEGVDVALLAKISCGIYAGPHKRRINNNFRRVVDEVLGEKVCGLHTRGEYFERVIIPVFPGNSYAERDKHQR